MLLFFVRHRMSCVLLFVQDVLCAFVCPGCSVCFCYFLLNTGYSTCFCFFFVEYRMFHVLLFLFC